MKNTEKKPVHRHTKGPWIFKEEMSFKPGGISGIIIQESKGEWIAEGEFSANDRMHPEFMKKQRANWHLMAAAPYMFDFFLGTFISLGLKVAEGASKETQATFLKMSDVINNINPELHDSIIKSTDGLESYNVTGLSTPRKIIARKKGK